MCIRDRIIEPLDVLEELNEETRLVIYPCIHTVLLGDDLRALLETFSAVSYTHLSIIPVQKAITPEIVMQSVTASLEESSAAFVTSGICPVNAAKKIPAMIMPAQRRFNIGYLESIFYYKLKVFYERKEQVMLKIKEIFATKCA